MALKVFKLTTPNMYLLVDGKNFKVVNKTQISDTITEDVAKDFARFLQTDEDILAIIAKLKKGMRLEVLDRTAVFAVKSDGYDNTNFMDISVCVNTPAMSSWTGMIMRDEGVIELPTGAIHEIWNYISNNSSGSTPSEETHSATSNKYYLVKSVEELPDNPTRTDIAYLLLKAAEGRPSGSMWRWNGRKWTSLTDGIPDDPDPIELEPEQPENPEPENPDPENPDNPNPEDPGTGGDEPNPENPDDPGTGGEDPGTGGDTPGGDDPGTGGDEPGGNDEPGGDTPNLDDPGTGEEPNPEDPGTGGEEPGDNPNPEDPGTGGDEPGGNENPDNPNPDDPGSGEDPGDNPDNPNPEDPGTGEDSENPDNPNPDDPGTGGDEPNPENPDDPGTGGEDPGTGGDTPGGDDPGTGGEDPGTGEEPGGDEPDPGTDPVEPEPEEPEPPTSPDPMDSNTYPDSEEKDNAPQAMGGNDVDVCEVIDNNISDSTSILSTELATIVNCSMGDGKITITVA